MHKPSCPFCGNDNTDVVIKPIPNSDKSAAYTVCLVCLAQGPPVNTPKTNKTAIRAFADACWATRVIKMQISGNQIAVL